MEVIYHVIFNIREEKKLHLKKYYTDIKINILFGKLHLIYIYKLEQ